jgi:D-xylose transport system ATP-binding protein
MTQETTKKPLMVLNDISKSFEGVPILKNVQLDIFEGEILGLVGENGAGKSTLMKIITGLYPSGTFQGHLTWDDRPCTLKNIDSARSLGINMVFQELSLVPQLSSIENLYLGAEISNRFGVIRQREEANGARTILERLGVFSLFDRSSTSLSGSRNPLTEPVEGLGIGQRQILEVGKALRKKTRLLILDEPTAALSPQESRRLLTTLKELRAEGLALIYISHRLHEVMELADRICVLRDGQMILTAPSARLSEDSLIGHMVGRTLTQRYPPPHHLNQRENTTTPLLKVEGVIPFGTRRLSEKKNLTQESPQEGISFSLEKGEILGVAGLMGAGRTELALCLFGLNKGLQSSSHRGKMWIDGRSVQINSPLDAMKYGMALVPEDRKRNGLVLDHSVAENMSLVHLECLSRWGVIDRTKQKHIVDILMGELKVKPLNPSLKVRNLSGGNQQKVCLGKWLLQKPRILILDEPTRGVDVGAKFDIYQKMRDLAAEGVGILMISSDMEEILGMSDRVMVLCQGKTTGILQKNQISSETIMGLAIPQKSTSPLYPS